MRSHGSPWSRGAVVVASALAVAALCFFFPGRSARSRPFVPTSPGDVLEHLAAPGSDPDLAELGRLRRSLRSDPRNQALAVRAARVGIALSQRRSDPRLLGQAQAILSPRW